MIVVIYISHTQGGVLYLKRAAIYLTAAWQPHAHLEIHGLHVAIFAK